MNLISHLLAIAVIRYLRIETDCLLQTTRILSSRVGWGGLLRYMYDGACPRPERHKLHTNGNQTSIPSHLGMTAVCQKIETGREKQTFLGATF